MTLLRYVWWCNHLTETGCTWRDVDYKGRNFVRGLKREEFNGYLPVTRNNRQIRYTTANIEEFVAEILPKIGAKLRDDIAGPISLVPIPNSVAVVGYQGSFRSLDLALMVAQGFGADCMVSPVLRWDAAREQAHKGHEYRSPELYEPHLRVVGAPAHPVVLFDDVLTSGSQMIAAARVLTTAGHPPRRGLVIAKATKAQLGGGLFSRHEDALELKSAPFNFDQF